ncbi:MAG: hypothetical protein WEB37_10425 [Bacteroidota bacterium]
MRQHEIGFSRFAKGLLVGGLAGSVASLVYVSRRTGRSHDAFTHEGARSQRMDLLPAPNDEDFIEAGKPAKSSVGWRVLRSLLYIGLISINVRIK